MDADQAQITGQCLCGAVRYEVRGPLADILVCHCVECQRWHGHVSATAACDPSDLVFVESRGLCWIQSPQSDAHARRGFCGECGSSLFWDSPDYTSICIGAGTLDNATATGLKTASHWYVSQAGDYYTLPDDGAPRHAMGAEGELD